MYTHSLGLPLCRSLNSRFFAGRPARMKEWAMKEKEIAPERAERLKKGGGTKPVCDIGVVAALILLLAVAIGCVGTTTASLYPIEGPLSKKTPLPVIVAKASGISENTGDISLTMPDGECCKGRWASAAGAGVSVGFGSIAVSSTGGTSSFFKTYSTTYGFGASMNTGTGQNPGTAMLTCDRGRVIQVEFITGAGTANGYGFAKDNKGNVYKLIF